MMNQNSITIPDEVIKLTLEIKGKVNTISVDIKDRVT